MIEPRDLPPDVFQGKPLSASDPKTGMSKDAVKKQQLLEALEQAQGNQTQAAELLGVTRVTIWNRMKKYGIATKQYRFTEEAP